VGSEEVSRQRKDSPTSLCGGLSAPSDSTVHNNNEAAARAALGKVLRAVVANADAAYLEFAIRHSVLPLHFDFLPLFILPHVVIPLQPP
jgi:hypothetical protein